jgi:Holliday junction resolvase RusA-like endonuclease
MLTVFIPGHPKPQGSKVIGRRKDGSAFMREANKNARPWRSVVIDALKPLATEPLEDAVRIHLHFYMPLLKKTPNFPTTRSSYDIDKLCRNMLDAVQIAGIIHDDSQVVSLIATKEYAERSGVQIRVENYTDFLDRFWE